MSRAIKDVSVGPLTEMCGVFWGFFFSCHLILKNALWSICLFFIPWYVHMCHLQRLLSAVILKFSRLPSWASEASLRTTFWPRFWMAWPLLALSRREVRLTEPVISLTRYSTGMHHSGMGLWNAVKILYDAAFALLTWPDDKMCVYSVNRLPRGKNSQAFSHYVLNLIPESMY